MGVSMTAQWMLFLGGVLLGVLWGGIWDLFRCMHILCGVSAPKGRAFSGISLPLIKDAPCRKREKGHTRVAKNICFFFGDVLFFLVAAVLFRVYLYLASEGIFRFFALLGAVGGFALYYFTLGRLVMLFSEYLLFGVRVVFFYLCYFLLFPFRFLGARLLRLVQVHRERTYHKRYMQRMIRSTERCFKEQAASFVE